MIHNWLFIFKVVIATITITQYQIVTMYLQYYMLSPTPVTSIKTATSTTSTLTTSSSLNYSGSYSFNETFSQIMLAAHNDKRSRHNSQSMAWNSTLFEYATRFAIDYDCSGILKHSGGPYGENLALGYTPQGAIDAWYQEGDTYSYQSNNVYNHFTQLIWNSSTQLGCAIKYCNSVWGNYIVCSYYVPGNIIGESLANVFPPT